MTVWPQRCMTATRAGPSNGSPPTRCRTTAPGRWRAPGFHDNRFLITWVNSVGAAEYMRYAEDPAIPAGTWIAKESFSVTDGGAVRPGPLFLMQKVAAGTSPETDDWYYMAVAANGSPMAVDVMSACSDCHQGAYGFQGGLGYPIEEARVTK